MKKMNLIQYVRTCFDTFDQLPFNEVDAAVLSQMAYLYIEENFDNNFSDKGMSVDQLMRAELFEEMCKTLPLQEELTQLIFAFVSSPRYRDARIKYYRNELNSHINLQFSAVVYSFGDQMHCVCFRGTDKTFVGWKEDLLLFKDQATACQMMSVNYLNGVGPKLQGELYITGHSKGGHLASYSASHCQKDIQDRILHVYNLDGPGFNRFELDYPGMLSIKDRITKFNPSESAVGDIMFSEVDSIIIKSAWKGFMSHSAFGWEIEDNHFVTTENSHNLPKKIIKNINARAENATDEEISMFAEIFFGLFEASDFYTYDELGTDRIQTVKLLTRSIRKTEPTKRKEMFRVLHECLRGIPKNKPLSEDTSSDDNNDLDYLVNDIETELFNQEYNLFL